MNKNKMIHLVYAAVFLVLILADRITKHLAVIYLKEEDKVLIPDILSLHYLENRGAAWGIFQNAFLLFFVITILVIGVMVFLYIRLPMERKYYFLRFNIVLLAAGAIGNFIDRVLWHYVVDFIYVEWINFPVFNVADCFVCISAVLFAYCLIIKYKDDELIWKKS